MNQNIQKWMIFSMLIAVITLSCSKSDTKINNAGELSNARLKSQFDDVLSNQVILDWNLAALDAEGGVTYGNPLVSSRTDAMMHIAMHDALNAIIPLYEQYTYDNEVTGADPILAAAQAAHTVLVSIHPDAKSMLDNLLAIYLSATPNGTAKQLAIDVGTEAANAILTLRQNDGASQNPVGDIAVSSIPGVYNTVPPFTFVFGEFWKNMEPFSLQSVSQFRSDPPPALTSMEYAKDFNEIKAIGGVTSTTRTEDQSFYAQFWYEFVEIGWNRIARILTTEKEMPLLATARLFALMNMAITDSYTAGWDSKYFYNFWRPYTAIHAADVDGNDRTTADDTWVSFLPTPPVPDYPSTHSTGGNAAATVIALLTKGNTSFTMTSSTAVPAGSTRSLNNVKLAADENAHSRVIAGIHFGFACEAGQEMGDQIGKWTVKNHLELRK
jgi:hypothetical protein